MEDDNLTPAEVHLKALIIEMEKYQQNYFAEHANYILKLISDQRGEKMDASIKKLPTHWMPSSAHRARATEQTKSEKISRAQSQSVSARAAIPITLKREPWSKVK